MCTTRILANSKRGFISQCTECDSIKVVFGTALVNLKEEEYQDFYKMIVNEVQFIQSTTNPDVKIVQLQFPSHPEFSLVLSINELMQLNDLNQEANILLEANKLINDKNR